MFRCVCPEAELLSALSYFTESQSLDRVQLIAAILSSLAKVAGSTAYRVLYRRPSGAL
jgi:hypothetical protein